MREQLSERLDALRSEYTAGQSLLSDLASRQAELQQTMLRISGAIQVLAELLGESSALPAEADSPATVVVPADVAVIAAAEPAANGVPG